MPSKLSQFWQELKRRKVVQVIVVYATVAFVLIELVDIISEPLLMPSWVLTLVIVLIAVGFPLAIVFSWIYDISSKGITRTEKVDTVSIENASNQKPEDDSGFENSIAVLPFEDMSPQKDQEYFCDGLTEEIINALTQVEGLKVIARTSVFVFKGKQKDIRDIGRKLNVNTLLEGSIRRDGNLLRITAQLIKASDGSHIWSKTYDREMKNVFQIQEEISQAMVENLKLGLDIKQLKGIKSREGTDPDAYDTLLKALYFVKSFSPDGMAKAAGLYEEFIHKSPDNAFGYFGLAWVYLWLSFLGQPPKMTCPKAKELLDKALELDSKHVEVYLGLGYFELFFNWNWQLAEERFLRAQELAPNYANNHFFYSQYLRFSGQHAKAIAEAERALELDPLSIWTNCNLADTLFYGHQVDKSIEKYRSILTVDRDFVSAIMGLGHAFDEKSIFKEAIEQHKKTVEISRGAPMFVSNLACSYFMNGEKNEAEKLYQDLLQRSKNEYITPFAIYAIHMVRDDQDQALAWLKKAIAERDFFLLYTRVCPTKGHRIPDDPRFKALLKGTGLDR